MLETHNLKDIVVVDDFIPVSLQEKYKDWLLKRQFPWYYVHDVTTANNLQFRPSVTHLLYSNGAKISTLDIDVLGHLGADKYGWKFEAIVQAKTILQFPLNPALVGEEKDNFHVDIDPFNPHLVVLYYVLDADGDTIISNMKIQEDMPTVLPYDESRVLQRVTPKQGRAVLFDGRYFHTAEQPKLGMRCVINLNIY